MNPIRTQKTRNNLSTTELVVSDSQVNKYKKAKWVLTG